MDGDSNVTDLGKRRALQPPPDREEPTDAEVFPFNIPRAVKLSLPPEATPPAASVVPKVSYPPMSDSRYVVSLRATFFRGISFEPEQVTVRADEPLGRALGLAVETIGLVLHRVPDTNKLRKLQDAMTLIEDVLREL